MNILIQLFFFLFFVNSVGLEASQAPDLHIPYIYHSVNVITGSYVESSSDHTLAGEYPLHLRRCYQSQIASDPSSAAGWFTALPGLFSSHQEGSLTREKPFFHCEYDREGRLVEIRSLHTEAASDCWIKFFYGEEEDALSCKAVCHDGTILKYHYGIDDSSHGKSSLYLRRVEKNGIVQACYTYKQHPLTHSLLLIKREEPDRRYLIAEYYDQKVNDVGGVQVVLENEIEDSRWGRVKLLKGPAGDDEAAVITHRFFYGPGFTEVRDALGHKVIYRYEDCRRLTAIEYYDEAESLYRVERYTWHIPHGQFEPIMTSRWLENERGEEIWKRKYEYDSSGQLARHTLFGQLTGAVDAREMFSTEYRYEDGRLVVKKEGSLETRFRYDRSGRLMLEHQVIDNCLHKRMFYEYNHKGQIITATVDDGTTDNRHDLAGVQMRRITRTVPSTAGASFGLPLSIEELYWDFETSSEKSMGKTVFEYSPQGLLIAQSSLDADGVCRTCTAYAYDSFGRLRNESEESGQVTTHEYDCHGNETAMTVYKPDGSVCGIRRWYDNANRILQEECTDSFGSRTLIKNSYNPAGLKVAQIEEGKGKTFYHYDAFGRLVRIQLPEVLDENNCMRCPVKTYQYDICDNVIASTDPNGWTTNAVYNVRGKPVEITYPEGAKELFQYNTAGMLILEKNRAGVTTAYKRDGLGRCLKATLFDAASNVLEELSSTYSTFHLVAQQDAKGQAKFYDYDYAGRQIALKESFPDGFKQISYAYNAQGELFEKKVFLENDCVVERIEYQDGSPYHVTTLSGKGEIIATCKVAELQDGKERRHGMEYNSLGQQVSYVEEVDCQGGVRKIVYDALGRVASQVSRDAFQQIIRQVEYRYDMAGNKVKEIHRNGRGGHFVLAWSYGPGGRLESCTEGEGSDRQRLTRYSYNAAGQMCQQIKPDGVEIRYAYYPCGRLGEVRSSDGSVCYRYFYDQQGNLSCVEDAAGGTKTTRLYDCQGHITQEHLANGLQIEFAYNQFGQRVRTCLSDGSSVAYKYEGARLKDIQRVSSQKKVLYAHSYLEWEGEKVKKSSLIGQLGILACQYTSEGNLASIKSPYWNEDVFCDEYGRIIKEALEDTAGHFDYAYEYSGTGSLAAEGGAERVNYTYDLLGNFLEMPVDELNQLSEYGGSVYAYDPNGNLISQSTQGGHTSFVYDALNRLIEVRVPEKLLTTYTYDGFNRRIAKKQAKWNAVKQAWEEYHQENYLYDGMCEIGAADGLGELKEFRVLGVGQGAEIGAAVAIELGAAVYAPIHDCRGNIAALVSTADRQVAESYRYSAFGRCRYYVKDGNESPSSELKMPWGFSCKRLNAETGWVSFGQRDYDPQTCRWTTPDPLGFADGENRYMYVHNNPVMNRDFYGEFTAGEAWHSFSKLVRYGMNMVSDAFDFYRQKIGYASYSKHEIEELANAVVTPFFLCMTGFYLHHPEVGVLGKGEVNDKVRITMINGILNIRAEYIQMVALLSKTHGGNNIHYVYRPSDGWAHDLMKCVMSKAGIVSSQSRLLARTWKKLIREMGGVNGGGVIIHYAHSIGGTETALAKRLMTPQERMMIRIYTFGSATLIPEGDFQSVRNYVSWRDGVCYFDPIAYARVLLDKERHTFFVGTPWGAPLVDHFLGNKSYMDVIYRLGADFVNQYGSLDN